MFFEVEQILAYLENIHSLQKDRVAESVATEYGYRSGDIHFVDDRFIQILVGEIKSGDLSRLSAHEEDVFVDLDFFGVDESVSILDIRSIPNIITEK